MQREDQDNHVDAWRPDGQHDGNCGSVANHNTDADADTDANADIDADANADAYANVDANADADAEVNVDANADANVDAVAVEKINLMASLMASVAELQMAERKKP